MKRGREREREREREQGGDEEEGGRKEGRKERSGRPQVKIRTPYRDMGKNGRVMRDIHWSTAAEILTARPNREPKVATVPRFHDAST